MKTASDGLRMRKGFITSFCLDVMIGGCVFSPLHVTDDAGSSFLLPNFFSTLPCLTNDGMKSSSALSEGGRLGHSAPVPALESHKTNIP